MKAFRCQPVTVNLDPRWALQVVEDGDEWALLDGHPFYSTPDACEAARDAADQSANGEDAP